MSIPIFITLMVPLFLAPLWTHQIMNLSFLRQRTFLALDNAAILLGREDRLVFNFLLKSNRFIAGLEKIHHPIHAIVRAGGASPNLVAQDAALEIVINQSHKGAIVYSTGIWKIAELKILTELRRMGTSLLNLKRETKVPVVGVRCPICFLEARWEINSRNANTYLQVKKDSWMPGLWVKPTGTSLLRGPPWNYKLSLN